MVYCLEVVSFSHCRRQNKASSQLRTMALRFLLSRLLLYNKFGGTVNQKNLIPRYFIIWKYFSFHDNLVVFLRKNVATVLLNLNFHFRKMFTIAKQSQEITSFQATFLRNQIATPRTTINTTFSRWRSFQRCVVFNLLLKQQFWSASAFIIRFVFGFGNLSIAVDLFPSCKFFLFTP